MSKVYNDMCKVWREKKLTGSYWETATEEELSKIAESVGLIRLPEATGKYIDMINTSLPVKALGETDEEFKN